jgi:hypothetical protein
MHRNTSIGPLKNGCLFMLVFGIAILLFALPGNSQTAGTGDRNTSCFPSNTNRRKCFNTLPACSMSLAAAGNSSLTTLATEHFLTATLSP